MKAPRDLDFVWRLVTDSRLVFLVFLLVFFPCFIGVFVHTRKRMRRRKGKRREWMEKKKGED